MTRRREPLRLAPARRRWDGVSWWYSTILLIPLLLILGDLLFGIGPDQGRPAISLRVVDQASGAAIPGARVDVAEQRFVTNGKGSVTFDKPRARTVIQVSANGYLPVYGQIAPGFGTSQSIALRPASVAAVTAAPEPTSTPSPEVVAPAETATVSAPKATEQSGEAVASGIVQDAQGGGIRGAVVRAGSTFTRTKRDGSFVLENADVGGGLEVQAPGFAKQTVQAGLDMTVTMERQDIRALYLNGTNAGNPEFVQGVIDLIGSTELNAVVIDTKENVIFYDTGVEFFREADVVQPTYDPAALVKQFEDNGIYTIARQVVFNDPLVAEHYQQYAVQREDGDGVWRGAHDDAWVNPFQRELWQPNIDLAVETAGFGFDEIQYDYIRFPSDGDLSTADFGPEYTAEGRVQALVDFLKETRAALTPVGVMFAIDVFGIVAIYDDDQGIGQRLSDLAPYVDYICPMVYPSHFDASSIDVGGEPNAFPYETVQLSMRLAKEKMPGMELKLRPWLQDFTLGDPPYGVDEVRAQIQAAEDEGTSGWMMWNAGSDYTEGAYEPG